MTFVSNAVSDFSRPERHDGPRVLFVGRKSDEKRVELFYEIARRCKLENDSLQFSVVGFEYNAPSVHHCGVVTDPQVLSDIYSEHDVLLVTSSREGFPMVIMEAMAHGLIVGASPVGDIPNRLEGSSAFITSHVAADIVVDELVQFVLSHTSDSEVLLHERLNSYNFSLEHFAMKKFVHDYKLLFEEK
jgi:glycosyltransferase involved in cell wall biosynthesis